MTERYSTSRRRSPNRLYRDRRHGKLLGVCAGIADYFGFNRTMVRVVAGLGLVMFTVPTVLAYLAAGLLVPVQPRDMYANADEAVFWREVRTEPGGTARNLRHTFRDQERRLAAIEAYVTSREFRLNRDIADL